MGQKSFRKEPFRKSARSTVVSHQWLDASDLPAGAAAKCEAEKKKYSNRIFFKSRAVGFTLLNCELAQ